jgi:hypothetical protein
LYQCEKFAPEKAKHLINKIYSVFISVNYKHFTNYCLMLRNFSLDINGRVNKKKSIITRVNMRLRVEIDSPASSGGQGKYMKNDRFPWHPLEAALSLRDFRLPPRSSD